MNIVNCHIHHKSVCLYMNIQGMTYVDNGIISRAAQEIRTTLLHQAAWETMLQNTFQRALLMK